MQATCPWGGFLKVLWWDALSMTYNSGLWLLRAFPLGRDGSATPRDSRRRPLPLRTLAQPRNDFGIARLPYRNLGNDWSKTVACAGEASLCMQKKTTMANKGLRLAPGTTFESTDWDKFSWPFPTYKYLKHKFCTVANHTPVNICSVFLLLSKCLH